MFRRTYLRKPKVDSSDLLRWRAFGIVSGIFGDISCVEYCSQF
jgi:hypothetical protein